MSKAILPGFELPPGNSLVLVRLPLMVKFTTSVEEAPTPKVPDERVRLPDDLTMLELLAMVNVFPVLIATLPPFIESVPVIVGPKPDIDAPVAISIFPSVNALTDFETPVMLILPAPELVYVVPVPVILPPTVSTLAPPARVPVVIARLPAIVIEEFKLKVGAVLLLSVRLFKAVTLEGMLNGPATLPP